MSTTLFEISEQQRQIEAMLEANEGEITPELEELMTINEENFKQKVEDYRNAILRKKANIDMAKSEKERIAKYIEQENNAIDNMKERLKLAMYQFGYDKYEINGGVGGKLSFRKSEKTIVDDEDWFFNNTDNPAVAQCVLVKKSVNLTEVKNALKDGVDLPAHNESNESLQVK